MRRYVFLSFLLASLFNLTQAEQPHQDETITKILSLTERALFVEVYNPRKEDRSVTIKSGPNGNVNFALQELVLKSGERRRVTLRSRIPDSVVLFVHVETLVKSEKTQMDGYSDFKSFTRAGRVFREIPLARAYSFKEKRIEGPSERVKINLGMDFVTEFKMSSGVIPSEVMPVNARALSITKNNPQKYLEQKLRSLPSLSRGGGASSGSVSGVIFPNDPPVIVRPPMRPLPIGSNSFENDNSDKSNHLSVSGNLSFRDGGDWVSAWAWVARVWQKDAGGTWRFYGWSYVSGAGDWSVEFAPGNFNRSRPFFVDYIAKNRFIGLYKADGDVYAWGDEWNWSGTGRSFSTGRRFANLSGDLPGMNEMYKGGSYFWTRFADEGINPLTDSTIRIVFPNTLDTGHCQSTDSAGNAIAWSCARTTQGEIYMTAQHANAFVVQHEIAHMVHRFFWGSFPPNSGGKHSISLCYTAGLGVVEGFANFVPYWIQRTNRQTAEVSGFGLNLETIPSTYCEGETNESRVAATFWDMYDVWNDGSGAIRDSMLFTNGVYIIAKFLSTKKNSMSDFLPVYQSGLNADYQDRVEQIFQLNTID